MRNHYLSLDPYMRGRMNDSKSYAAPQALGAVMLGGTVGEVVESRNPKWKAGDKVVAGFGWQEYGTSNGAGMQKVDDSRVPLSAYLGAGRHARRHRMVRAEPHLPPKPGETVAVSAASGAVGTVVGQLAKRRAAAWSGIAGGADKCRYVVDELGFDACVDYKAGRLEADLEAAAPGGIDGYFDNVGGAVLDAVMARMNAFGRIAVCGAISGYDGEPMTMADPRLILVSRLRSRASSCPSTWRTGPPRWRELGGMVADGR